MPDPTVVGEDLKVDERQWDQDGHKAKCEFTSDVEITTEEEALSKGQVDTSVWFVRKMRIGSHQVSMKIRHQTGVDGRGKPTYAHTPIKKSNWKISLDLERINGADAIRAKAADALCERLSGLSLPKIHRIPQRASTGRHVVEMGFYDTHFGVLVWSEEAYESCNLSDSEEIFANAVDDALDSVRGYNVDRWVFPVCNDGMHFDNLMGTTTGGTPQHASARYAQVLASYETALIKAVLRMLQVAPVDVVVVPGNHDQQSAISIGRILNAYFHGNKDVRVDTSPRLRKYYRYGTNLIGYTHGNNEKIADLTRHMPLEVPGDVWAATTCHEFHVGHWHKSKMNDTIETDEHNGIRVWTNPSLKVTDEWHYKNGYVGARRAGRCYIYEREDAFKGFFEFAARLKMPKTNAFKVDILGDSA